ncbi:MAG: tail fiber domain-containing protein [Ignavibacteriaceae bacterium]
MQNRFITKAFINNFQSSRILFENCGRLLWLPLLVLTLTKSVYSQSEAFRVKSPKDASLFYVQSDGSVGVDTSTTLGSLTVNGNNGIIATGTFGSGTALNLGAGTRMMWYPQKAAFRVGSVPGSQWDDSNIGEYSFASGAGTTASGFNATAMGDGTTASGTNSTGIGLFAHATGDNSIALGSETNASGTYSTAMGYYVTASGNYSIAMGSNVTTNSKPGSFIFGDNSSNFPLSSAASNSISMRFANGYEFYTNSSTTTGAFLGANQTAWSVISDSTKKENFIPVNGEDVLNKISKFNLRSWNYKGQNPKLYRHYGPMAQEFFKAFGHDKIGVIGNDTTINSADFAGINLIAIQALEKRTNELNKAVNELKVKQNELDALKANYTELKNEFEMSNIKWQKVEDMLNKLTNSNLSSGQARVVVSEK